MKSTLRKIDGILLLDKPLHITSNGALQRVKRLFGAKKAGHTGSLDPLATGMLPLCFGEATKFSQFLLESDKYYRVSAKLGVKTTTGDAEGDITETKPVPHFNQQQLENVFSQFTGSVQQIPPMHSAVKHKGKPLYELARKGLNVERKPRLVKIYLLKLGKYTADTLNLDIHCSKGTYVRTLIEDIGDTLGCGAHVSGLRRLSVTPYQNVPMITLEELEEAHKRFGVEGLNQYLLSAETSVQSLPVIRLSTVAAFYIRSGQAVMVPHLPKNGLVQLISENNQFIGVGEVTDDGRVAPRRLVN
jgi:tRNA pseudouridine55 synthase